MPRFYIPPSRWNADNLTLTGAEAHHAADVLRMQPGDRATLFNGEGVVAEASIRNIQRGRIDCECLSLTSSPPPPCRITLGQAIPKGKNMELIIEKATELGAAEIVPLLTERTVVQLPAQDAARKQDKWQRVAIEAAKQCGQNWLPRVHEPQTLESLFASTAPFDLMLAGSLEPDARHPRHWLSAAAVDRPSSVLALIGPEGDFSPEEHALAKAHGCKPISLGPIILRVETAAIYCLSILSYELLQS